MLIFQPRRGDSMVMKYIQLKHKPQRGDIILRVNL